MTEATSTVRRKRFDRVPEAPSLNITDRHLNILSFIARFRFVSVHQIAAHDGGSKQKVRRILRDLFDGQMVERPRSQIVNIFLQAYKPTVYSLDIRGAELLAERHGLPLKPLSALANANRLSARHIDHTVETAQHMLAFLIAGAERGLRLVDHRDLSPSFPPETRRSKRPFALPLDFDGVRQFVQPDRLFTFVDAAGNRSNYALEVDRSSMPIERSFDSASSFGAKLPLYLASFNEGLHTKRWGFKRMRVLTITPSEARLEHMLDAARNIEHAADDGKNMKSPPGLFLFITPERLKQQSPLDAVWSNIKGERVDLALAS